MLQNCKKTCGICKSKKIKSFGSSKSKVTDCKWSAWDQWSSCSKTCGRGLQEITRTVAISAKNGGRACVGSNKDSRLCNNGACKGIKAKNTPFRNKMFMLDEMTQ